MQFISYTFLGEKPEMNLLGKKKTNAQNYDGKKKKKKKNEDAEDARKQFKQQRTKRNS